MTSGPAPMCVDCKYYFHRGLACKAFPDGIPDDILFAEFDHREPHPKDGGIQFSPLPDRDTVVTRLGFYPWDEEEG